MRVDFRIVILLTTILLIIIHITIYLDEKLLYINKLSIFIFQVKNILIQGLLTQRGDGQPVVHVRTTQRGDGSQSYTYERPNEGMDSQSYTYERPNEGMDSQSYTYERPNEGMTTYDSNGLL